LLTLQSDYDTLCSDLVFIQDCTGSQGSYISSATKNIQLICENIYQSGKLQAREDLRVGLVAFRDHPPQDHTYVTRNFGFSSDIDKVHRDLSSLYASGGGDGPEAVTAGLAEALKMDWREQASKMIVLIADAPPHGVGEYADGEFACSPPPLPTSPFFSLARMPLRVETYIHTYIILHLEIRIRRWVPRRQ